MHGTKAAIINQLAGLGSPLIRIVKIKMIIMLELARWLFGDSKIVPASQLPAYSDDCNIIYGNFLCNGYNRAILGLEVCSRA